MTGYADTAPPLTAAPTSAPHWRLQCPPPEQMPDTVAPALAAYLSMKERAAQAHALLLQLRSDGERDRRKALDLDELAAAAHRGETPSGTPNADALPGEIKAAEAEFAGLDVALRDLHAVAVAAINAAAADQIAPALAEVDTHAAAVEDVLHQLDQRYGAWVLAARRVLFWQRVAERRVMSYSDDPQVGSFSINGVHVDRAQTGAAGSSIAKEMQTVADLLHGPHHRTTFATDGFTVDKRKAAAAALRARKKKPVAETT